MSQFDIVDILRKFKDSKFTALQIQDMINTCRSSIYRKLSRLVSSGFIKTEIGRDSDGKFIRLYYYYNDSTA